MNIPLGVDYINGGLDASDTCDTLESKANVSEVCLGHLLSPSSLQKNVILLEHQDSTSICENCFEEGTVCYECTKKGHKFPINLLNLPCVLAVDVLTGIPNVSRL